MGYYSVYYQDWNYFIYILLVIYFPLINTGIIIYFAYFHTIFALFYCFTKILPIWNFPVHMDAFCCYSLTDSFGYSCINTIGLSYYRNNIKFNIWQFHCDIYLFLLSHKRLKFIAFLVLILNAFILLANSAPKINLPLLFL